MSSKYKFKDSDQLYFVSFSVVYWIDVFIRPLYKELLIDSLKYCMACKGLELYAWCIMPSHLHLIISSQENTLSNILHDFKRFTAIAVRKAIQSNDKESRKAWILWMMQKAAQKNKHNDAFQFWQQDNHPVHLSNLEMMRQRLHYLHANPVKEGFVSRPEDYVYSSATDYMGEKGLLDIILLDFC